MIRALTQVWLIFALIPPVLQPKQAQARGHAEASALGSGEGRGGQNVRTEARGDLSCRVREIQWQCPRTTHAARVNRLVLDTTPWSRYYPLAQVARSKPHGLGHREKLRLVVKGDQTRPGHLACWTWCRTFYEVGAFHGSC